MEVQDRINRRGMLRVRFIDPVTVVCGDRKITGAADCNVSATGLYVATNEGLPPGAVCQVRIDREPADQSIEVQANVIRTTGDGMALVFKEFGLGSFEALRRMILSLADDPLRVEAEFERYLGWKVM